MIEISKLFIVIGLIALPNLYYKPEYNVPLMAFAYSIWSEPYKHTIMYLLLVSWFADAVWIFKEISEKDGEQSNPLFIGLSIAIFVLKIICIILLMIFDIKCRFAYSPGSIWDNFKQTFIDAQKQEKQFRQRQ